MVSFNLRKILLYWNTLRFIRFKQVFGRFKKNFTPKPKIRRNIKVQKSVISGHWQKPASRDIRMVSENHFRFLNESYAINSPEDWNNSSLKKLWLFNLHYFDDLTSFDAFSRKKLHHNLIQRWIDENIMGVGTGWESYPTSLRIVNWIKWALAGNELESEWLISLRIQTEWLSKNLETHLLGNHLFANAKALVYSSLFLEESIKDNFYDKGINIINRELNEQVLHDGGNFELSTMYHIIFLEDLIDLVNIHRAYNKNLPDTLKKKIIKMIEWMDLMSHPDGKISFFNDASFGITPSIVEIKEYAKRLNLQSKVNLESDFSFFDLPNSGYSRVQSEAAVAIIDRGAIGPKYLPAHAHADTLSFELSLFGQRVVVNSGTSTYEDSVERHNQRSTLSHSTISIDNQNSSEVWSSFRVARRANIFNRKQTVKKDQICLSASHDGYKRLIGKPLHKREWLFKNQSLIVTDIINGNGIHSILSVIPIHPDIEIIKKLSDSVILNVNNHKVILEFKGNGVLSIEESDYHPEFGLSNENKQLHYYLVSELPSKIIMRVNW
jgi:uncharacterized heparinase superfamily protein